MNLSICSYSFHRLLETGRQDIFRYIADCHELGCTLLDPWNAHLPQLQAGDSVRLSDDDRGYLRRINAAAEAVGLPFGCVAVDGAHVYEADPEARRANRVQAERWLAIATVLEAQQVRIDAGGSAEMPDPMFEVIVDGYRSLVKRAADKGVEVLIENHWGASNRPENLVRILDAVPGLGLLFDTNNWAPGTQQQGWETCARYARATHIKTMAFDDKGDETTEDIPGVMRLLIEAGYRGGWGVESIPEDGDEYGAARKTIDLIRRTLTAGDSG